MDRSDALQAAKKIAEEEGLDTSWQSIEQRLDLSALSPYYRRQVRIDFECWITRQRNPTYAQAR